MSTNYILLVSPAGEAGQTESEVVCPIVVFSRSVCSYTLAATVFASQLYVLSRLFALLGQQIKGKYTAAERIVDSVSRLNNFS